MKISYLDGSRLRSGLIAGCDFVQHRRAELNRINVYPVPDGDTGTNLALTTASIADRLRGRRDAGVDAVAREAAEGAVLGARGNCGMILSHFLLGFADRVDGRRRVTVPEFAAGLRGGVDHVYSALERPVEGTILTVMRETAEEAEGSSATDFADLVDALLGRARASLARTPDLLPVLRSAGVVDAGGKGFVHLLEGIAARIHGDPLVALVATPSYEVEPAAAAAMAYPQASERYRFCTEALVRGDSLPSQEDVRSRLGSSGDSLIVIRTADVLKIHIHTDEPDAVFAYLRSVGELATHKAEDMQAQHAAVERAAAGHVSLARRPVSIVTDTACDLPDEIVRAHGIHLVPMSVVFGNEVLRDRIEIDAATFTRRMTAGAKSTTSQPPPGEFAQAFKRAAEDGEHIVAVILSSGLSGTFASAEAAAKRFTDVPVTLVDSRAATLSQGLLVLRASELAELGWEPAVIAQELLRIRAQSGLFFTVDTFENLLASGRVGRGRAWLGGLLHIKPILALDDDGRIKPVARVRGREAVMPRVLDLLTRRIATGARVRFGVVHVAAPEIVEPVTAGLRARWPECEVISNHATPVISTHTGPGAWALAYQVED